MKIRTHDRSKALAEIYTMHSFAPVSWKLESQFFIENIAAFFFFLKFFFANVCQRLLDFSIMLPKFCSDVCSAKNEGEYERMLCYRKNGNPTKDIKFCRNFSPKFAGIQNPERIRKYPGRIRNASGSIRDASGTHPEFDISSALSSAFGQGPPSFSVRSSARP